MEIQKKISFGFSKSSKPINIFKTRSEKRNDVELIDCLEGQSIKIKNIIEEEKKPLIIPLRDNAKGLFDRVKNATTNKDNCEKEDPDISLSLDELAAKQLIEEAAQRTSNNNAQVTKVQVLPVSNNKLPNQNDKESTLDDYNDIPISDYGMAMLRGMGWTESTGIGNQNKQITNISEPELRPRGLGLGANKLIKLKEISVTLDKDGQELLLAKGAFAKVIAGKHSGNYCEVLSLDDETGRIIVKTALEKNLLSISESLLVPVTKEEYTKNSKVLNHAKYEEYTKKRNGNEQKNESGDIKSEHREYKLKRRKSESSSSEEKASKHSVHKSKQAIDSRVSSSRDNKYRKRGGRSESPYNSKHKRSSPDSDRKSKKTEQNTDESEDDEYEERSRRKKLKKHRKNERDSSDEEYRKRKKSKKAKKYRSHKSDEDTSRSKYKHKHSKSYR